MSIFTPIIVLIFLFCRIKEVVAQEDPQTACQIGKITLRNTTSLTTTDSDLFGEDVNVTFKFCTLQTTEESICGNTPLGKGYVEVTNNTECLESFTDLIQPLTLNGPQSTYFIVSNTNRSSTFLINMQCNSSGIPDEVYFNGQIDTYKINETIYYEANFTSFEGCEANNFFCETPNDCIGTSCLNGICIDTTCPILSSLTQTVTVPSNYLSIIRITDCYGFPIQGLLPNNISVLINGDSIDVPPLSFEVDNVRREAQQAGSIIQITTIMIHQSRYVTSQYEDELKLAIKALLTSFSETQSTNHYIALVVYDGSVLPITVQAHTTDFNLLSDAVDSLPLNMPDPLSTNLYGAVVYGLESSYQMKSTFDVDSYSTLLIFSDGYDTASRISEMEAIQKSQYFASKNVTTLALGISNRSDPIFLRQIATSGYYESSSVDSLAEVFQRMAQRIISLHRNVYYVLMCVPTRKGNITVTVSLSPTETFQNIQSLEYNVDTNGFYGGCNESLLNSTITDDNSSINPGVNSKYLPPGGSIEETLTPYGALFFYSNCTNEVCLVNVNTNTTNISNISLTILVLVKPRCVLSPFCFDDSFDNTYEVWNNESDKYQFMLLSGFNISTNFIINSLAPPKFTVPPPFLSINQTGIREMAGQADKSAVIIFAIATIVILIGIVFCLFIHCRKESVEAFGKGTCYKETSKPHEFYPSRISLDAPPLPQMEQNEVYQEDTSYYYLRRKDQ